MPIRLEIWDHDGDKDNPIPFGGSGQLLSAWLNFANGAIEHHRLVDTNADGAADTKFPDAIAAAESLRLNPTTTRQQLDRQARIIESGSPFPNGPLPRAEPGWDLNGRADVGPSPGLSV